MKWVLMGWILVDNTWVSTDLHEEFYSYGQCEERADYYYYALSEYPFMFDCLGYNK